MRVTNIFYMKRNIFIAIVVILIIWLIYTNFFASAETLKASDIYHVDKIMHFLGGLLVVGVAVSYLHVSRMQALFLLVLLIVGWEVFEVLFLPNVRYFYETLHEQWLSDTRGDIIVGFMGGLFYSPLCRRLTRQK
jgi:hypothetical protein